MTALADRPVAAEPPAEHRRPALREDWEYDPAHQACQQWMTAWRHTNPDAARPPLRFADHLGRCAVSLAADGLSKVEIARLFSAAGYDGTCACGIAPEQIPPIPPTTKEGQP